MSIEASSLRGFPNSTWRWVPLRQPVAAFEIFEDVTVLDQVDGLQSGARTTELSLYRTSWPKADDMWPKASGSKQITTNLLSMTLFEGKLVSLQCRSPGQNILPPFQATQIGSYST